MHNITKSYFILSDISDNYYKVGNEFKGQFEITRRPSPASFNVQKIQYVHHVRPGSEPHKEDVP